MERPVLVRLELVHTYCKYGKTGIGKVGLVYTYCKYGKTGIGKVGTGSL
jgi:hypothetical protein